MLTLTKHWEFQTVAQREAFKEKWGRHPCEAMAWYRQNLVPKMEEAAE